MDYSAPRQTVLGTNYWKFPSSLPSFLHASSFPRKPRSIPSHCLCLSHISPSFLKDNSPFPSLQAEVYAPNIPQMHVVDHVKGQPTPEQRNVLVESARIARGNIKDLATLDVKGLDALIIPGRIVWGLPVHSSDIP